MRFLIFVSTLLASSLALAGTATLTLSAPTENTDGSPLEDLAGFRYYYGCVQPGTYSDSVTVEDPEGTMVVLDQLPDGVTCYFAATAINALGIESSFSNEASKNMPGVAGSVPEPPLVTSVTANVAYGLVISRNNVALLPVGTLPEGVSCNEGLRFNDLFAVPREQVNWYGNVEYEAVFAECEGQ